MNRKATGKTYLDDLPAEALCEGGSRIFRSTILCQGYGWQDRSFASFTWIRSVGLASDGYRDENPVCCSREPTRLHRYA